MEDLLNECKFAFLNGVIKEGYIDNLWAYIIKGHEDKVLMLKKTRAWKSRINKYFSRK